MEIFNVFGRLRLDDSGFNKGIGNAKSAGKGLAGVMAGVGKAVAGAAVAMGAALVGLGVAAYRVGVDFDASLRGIRAQTGQTVEDLERTEEAVRSLAVSQGRFSAQEMVDSLASVSAYGQDSEHQLMLLNNAMRLSDLTGENLQDSMYRLDAIMVKFSDETLGGAVKFTNMFATAQSIAKVSNDSLLEGLQRSAGITSQAGLAYDFVAGALTRAYQGGLSMANGATGLNRIFSDMMDSTSNVRGVMDDLGVAVTRNADGSIDYQSSLTDLMNVMRGLDYDTRAAKLSTIGWSGSASDMFNVLKNETQYVDELSEAFRYGMKAGEDYSRAFDMIEARTGGVEEGFARLRNIMNESLKVIWDVIQTPLGEALGEINEKLLGLSSHFMPLVGDAIGGLIGLLTGAEGASEKFADSIAGIAEEINRQIPVFLERGADIVLGLVEGIAVALPALIDGVMKVVPTIIETILGMLPALMEAGISAIVAIADGLAEALPELIPMAIEAVLAIVDALLDNLDMIIDAAIALVLGLVEGITKALPILVDKIPEIVTKIVMALVRAAPQLLEAAGAIIGTLAEGILKTVPRLVFTLIPSIVSKIARAFGLDAVADFIDAGISIVEGFFDGIAGKARWLYEKVYGFFSDLVAGVLEFFGINSPSTLFAEIGLNIILGLFEGLKGLASGALEFFAEMRDRVLGLLDIFLETITEIGGKVVDFFIGAIMFLPHLVFDIFREMRDMVLGIVEAMPDSLKELAIKIIDWYIDGIKNIAERAREVFDDMRDRVLGVAGELPGRLKEIGGNIIDGLIEGITGSVGRAVDAVRGAVGSVVDGAKSLLGISSPSRVFVEFGENTGEGYIIGVKNMYGKIKKAVDDVFGGFGDYSVGGVGQLPALSGIAGANATMSAASAVSAPQNNTGGNTYILQVKMDEVDELYKLKETFDNFMDKMTANVGVMQGV